MKELAATAPVSALDELLAAEEEIATKLADAARNADALVAAARADAAAREREVEAQLDQALAALDQAAQQGRGHAWRPAFA